MFTSGWIQALSPLKRHGTYFTVCEVASGKMLHSTGSSVQHSVMSQRGGMMGGSQVKREGIYVSKKKEVHFRKERVNP